MRKPSTFSRLTRPRRRSSTTESGLFATSTASAKVALAVALAVRGFCALCGSSLFWKAPDRDYTAISAGTTAW